MSVAAAMAATGAAVAVLLGAWVIGLRRRLELVAEAAHELRGSAATIALAGAATRHQPGGLRIASALESELERMRAGLADLDASRTGGARATREQELLSLDRVIRRAATGWRPVAACGGRRLSVSWEGPPAAVRADRGRLAQAFGNLLANAFEHGTGPVALSGRSDGETAVVEVRDHGPAATARTPGGDRGRGLGIASRAVADAGGSLRLRSDDDGTVAAVEIPVVRR